MASKSTSSKSIAAFNAAQAKKNTPTQGTAVSNLSDLNLNALGKANLGIGAGALMNNTSNQNDYQALLDAQNQKINGLQSQIGSLTGQLNQYNDITSQINALNQAKQAQAIADLGKARDNQLSNLSTQEASINPLYESKRNAAASTNMAGRRTLAEELAARGEANSGVADQAQLNANMSLQNDLGTLNAQQASDLSNIANQRTNVQNAYQSDLASTKAGLDAQTMQDLINQYNQNKQYQLQEAALTGTYNGAKTLDATNSDRNFALNQAGVTGTYNGKQTLDAQNQAYNQDLQTKQYNQQVQQQKLDNLYRQQTFNYQKARDAVTDSQWQQNMNLNLRQESFQEAQQKIENALSQKRISQDDASQALQWAKFNADNDPSSLDNQYKKAQLDALKNSTSPSGSSSKGAATADDYAKTINSLYVTKGKMDTKSIKSYIDSLILSGVDSSITDNLAARYGIK